MTDKGRQGMYVICGDPVTLAIPGNCQPAQKDKKRIVMITCTMQKGEDDYGKMVL